MNKSLSCVHKIEPVFYAQDILFDPVHTKWKKIIHLYAHCKQVITVSCEHEMEHLTVLCCAHYMGQAIILCSQDGTSNYLMRTRWNKLSSVHKIEQLIVMCARWGRLLSAHSTYSISILCAQDNNLPHIVRNNHSRRTGLVQNLVVCEQVILCA